MRFSFLFLRLELIGDTVLYLKVVIFRPDDTSTMPVRARARLLAFHFSFGSPIHTDITLNSFDLIACVVSALLLLEFPNS